jgi:4-amino-4-deoxy-L-arabinose transferase-like glycosyltransferase
MSRNPVLIILFLLWASAFSLRIFPILGNEVPFSGHDELEYTALAKNLAAGNGFVDEKLVPTAWRTPGLPAFLAIAFTVIDADEYYSRIALVFVSSLTPCLIYFLAFFITRNQVLAVVAALFWILMLNSRVMAPLLLGEELASLLVAVYYLLAFAALRKKSLVFCAAAGLVIGSAILTRGYLLPLALAVPIFLFVSNFKKGACVCLVFSVLLPNLWAVRNYYTMDVFSLSTETPEVIWLGNNQFARGSAPGIWHSRNMNPNSPIHEYLIQRHPNLTELNETEISRVFADEAYQEITGNPARSIILIPKKIIIFFVPYSYFGIDWAYLIILPFSFLGMAVLLFDRRRAKLFWILVFPILGALVINILAFADVRHRHPLNINIILLGVFSFSYLYSQKINLKRLKMK